LRETIEIYKGFVLSINLVDFEANLYKDEKPFATGTFYQHILSKNDLSNFNVGSQFIFEIYRENGNIKWSIEFLRAEKDNGNASKPRTGKPH
jgi:hypothetical protein